MNRKIFALLFSIIIFSGCEDIFEPPVENILEKEFMLRDATFASGFLMNAYLRLPTNGWKHSDVATDNAVSNDLENEYRRMATGEWTSQFNPADEWRNSRSAIQYVNMIINNADEVAWAMDEDARLVYADRFKGEAYGLRAVFNLFLMQYHAGFSARGELLGIPLVTEVEEVGSDFNTPRSSFEESMQFIYADLDSAMALLPLDYPVNADDPLFLEKYAPMGIEEEAFTRAFGQHAIGRMSRRIAEAIRSRATLFAASPAFYSDGNSTTWETAVKAAEVVLERIQGIDGLSPVGHQWFSRYSEIDGLSNGANPAEIIWRTSNDQANELEGDNYPPSLSGNGRINPSQNLVDAFPMANGYPIGHASSNYDLNNPYADRDPRLEQTVVINNGTAGPSNAPIVTAADGNNEDALNNDQGRSTRTGYYLRKLLRMDVNVDPASQTTQRHYRPHIRYTEIFLNYAEAANEIYGPGGTGDLGFSAYDVVKAIRSRAGVGGTDDPYLESIRSDKDAMRTLIRNERRLELSFEDFRFLDLRRWKADLTEGVRGMRISEGAYSVINVENRPYREYMHYGPIPYQELLKYDALQQNQGW